MLCFRCGSPVSDAAGVCDNCGQDLGNSAKAPGDKFAVLQRRLRQTSRQLFEAAAYQVGELVAERYEITDVVGTGALGMVYKAFDQEVEVEVALKVMSGEYLPDEESRKHFLTSLQRVRDLVHDNVVRYLDVDRDGDRCFYVMQFLEGLTLRKIIDLRRSKGQSFSLSEVEPICIQLCQALGNTAWQIVHGGMKPENVIILPDLLKVTDFAMADALPLEAYIAAQRGSGESICYMAPEIRAQEDYDVRADVYSLAVIVLEMLTGEQYKEGPVSALTENAEVPETVDDVLQRALSEDPEERQEDAGQLGKELRDAFAGRSPRETLAYGVKAEDVQEAVKKIKERVAQQQEGDEAAADFSDPEAPPPTRETSGVTHQLDMDDIEFGSQSVRSAAPIPGEDDYEEEILTGPPPSLAGDEVDGSTQKMKKDDLLAHRREAAEEDILPDHAPAQQPAMESQVPTLEGVGDNDATQKIDPKMIVEGEDEDEAEQVLLVPPPTGPVKSLEDADAVSGETSSDPRQRPAKEDEPSYRMVADELSEKAKSKDSHAREARAREALQAFDFDASLQAAIDSAVQPGEESSGQPIPPDDVPPDVSDTIPESQSPLATETPAPEAVVEAPLISPPAPAYPPAQAAQPAQPAVEMAAQTPAPGAQQLQPGGSGGAEDLGAPPLQPMATGPFQTMPGPVAAEVLHADAVPAPLRAMPTERVFVPEPLVQKAHKNRALPIIIVILVIALLGGTAGAVAYISWKRAEDARLEYERKRQELEKQASADEDDDKDEPEEEPEPKPAPKTEEKPEPKVDEQPVPAPDEKTEPAPKEQPEPKPAPKTEDPPPTRVAKPEPKPEPVVKPKRKPKPTPAVASRPKRRPKPKPAPAVASRPKRKPKPAPKPEPKPEPAVAPKAETGGGSKCNRGMKYIAAGGGYCIDRYEYPGRGRKPKKGVSLAAARGTCTKRGLRLCTAKEWSRACSGTRSDRCNHGGLIAASGSKKGCRSRYGIYDMSGNVSEWVSSGRAMGGDAVATKGGCGTSAGGGGMTGFRCCGDVGWDMD